MNVRQSEPRSFNLTAKCCECGAMGPVIPAVLVSGHTPRELTEMALPTMAEAGFRPAMTYDGREVFVCDMCRVRLLEKLPAYDSSASCAKCGGDNVATEYVPLKGTIFHREHMKRTCNRCRFVWGESPKDAK